MKKVVLAFLLVLTMGCSKEEDAEIVYTTSDLIGSWQLISNSYKGENLDACDLKSSLTFSLEEITITGSYWGDDFKEEDCRTFSEDHRYDMEGMMVWIEYDGSVSRYGVFRNKNTLELKSTLNGNSYEEVYQKK